VKPLLQLLGPAVLFIVASTSCHAPSPVGPVPGGYQLNQNYPNPFQDTTTVQYGVPSSGAGEHLVLEVLDLQRTSIRVLENSINHPAGTFHVTWDGRDAQFQRVPSGLYVIELRSGNFLGIEEGMNGVYGRIMAVRK
jgi:hypothetical protein